MTITTNTSHWRVTGYAVTCRGTILCFTSVGLHGDAATCRATCEQYAAATGGKVVAIRPVVGLKSTWEKSRKMDKQRLGVSEYPAASASDDAVTLSASGNRCSSSNPWLGKKCPTK